MDTQTKSREEELLKAKRLQAQLLQRQARAKTTSAPQSDQAGPFTETRPGLLDHSSDFQTSFSGTLLPTSENSFSQKSFIICPIG